MSVSDYSSEGERERAEKTSTQEKFNLYIENYNTDFLFFLQRAATGNYNCLVTSGRILKDLHDFVIFMHRATGLKFEVVPYPFTFRHGREYYRDLGFDDDDIDKIHGFFDHVKNVYDKEFEECMKESTKFLCAA